jgi:hypothetical protein
MSLARHADENGGDSFRASVLVRLTAVAEAKVRAGLQFRSEELQSSGAGVVEIQKF